MNSLFSRTLLGTGLLSFGILSGMSAEPVRPSFPTQTPSTNVLSVMKPLPITLPEPPFFEQGFASMFRQRLSERAVDPLTPSNLQSIQTTRGAYELFMHDTGRSIIEGAGKQTLQDWGTGKILPNLSLNGKPLTEFGNGLVFGSVQGVQRRDLRPRESVYTLPSDLALHPREQHPLLYSWGIDPFRLDPKFHTTIAARDATRVFRLSTSHEVGEASFDVFDNVAYMRFGVRAEYQDFKQGSSAFVSLTPRFRSIPLNFTVGANPQGTVTASLGLHYRF